MNPPHPQNDDPPNSLFETYRKMEPFLGLGLTFAVTILAFLFLGRWLDSKWGTSPWLLIAGAALGMILGFVHMITTLQDLDKQEAEEQEQEKDAE